MNIRHTEVRPRERLINAAYDLFSKDGVSQVGIDTILAKSDCAKASLYSNFKTKVELAIAFLDKREAVWTRGWLESEIKRRAKTPEGRLLAIFDVFDGWFHKKSFEGCSFINVLLESRNSNPPPRHVFGSLMSGKTSAGSRGSNAPAGIIDSSPVVVPWTKTSQRYRPAFRSARTLGGISRPNAPNKSTCRPYLD